ncbi:phosphatidic acid phosphatase type 2/haloperoxidase [Tirmania nivea]|nr:phosphatidic acid phosphatase type 2/haloperoxidase [Tirmania nivea]
MGFMDRFRGGPASEIPTSGARTSRGLGVRVVDNGTAGAAAPTTSTRKHTIFGRLFDGIFRFTTTDPFGPRPTLTTWLKIYWGDILTLFLLGMLSLGLLLWSPLPRFKYFPVYTDVAQSNLTPGDELVYPQFAAPKMSQHIPIVADALISLFAPFIVVWIMNIFIVHSFWDVNNACIGTVVSVMTGCVIQIIIKLLVAGLRPHFLTVCNPMSPSESLARGVLPKGGFGGLYYTVDVCREKDGKKLANAMQSFPSGHSCVTWAGLFYLSLYLNGKLKPFSNYHPSWWKLLAVVTPMVAATLVVGSLTLDMSHNWYDIAFGSAIGVLVAIGSYRMTYASVTDWRWSHVPLPRGNMYVLETGASSGGHALEKGSYILKLS